MEDFIVILNKEKYEKFSEADDLINFFMGEDNYNLKSNSEKLKIRNKKAFINSKGDKSKIINAKKEIEASKKPIDVINSIKADDEKILIDNDITYITSLLRRSNDNIVILENLKHAKFTKGINIGERSGNYIIVNSYSNEILNEYISKCYNNSKEAYR